METLKFKTNINCGGCIVSVTRTLNSLEGMIKWDVDTTNPSKVLTIQTAQGLNAGQIITSLRENGFSAEEI